MFCPSCGRSTPDEAQFCASCGAYLASALPPGQAGVPAAQPWIPGESLAPGARPYAGFWMRFLATFIDGFILQFAQWILILPLLVGMGLLSSGSPRAVREAMGMMFVLLLVLTSLLVQWLYEAGFTSSPRQGTPGKMALGVVVTDENGNRISFGRATGRFAGKILSSLTFLIGYLIQPFTPKKQALHDLLAGTLVLRGKPESSSGVR